MHTTMMSMPFQVGIIPEQWTRITDIMLEKTPQDSRCHRLHIIALLESALNHVKRIIIGRKLTQLRGRKNAFRKAIQITSKKELLKRSIEEGFKP
jgi:hypothetical protein